MKSKFYYITFIPKLIITYYHLLSLNNNNKTTSAILFLVYGIQRFSSRQIVVNPMGFSTKCVSDQHFDFSNPKNVGFQKTLITRKFTPDPSFLS